MTGVYTVRGALSPAVQEEMARINAVLCGDNLAEGEGAGEPAQAELPEKEAGR